MRRPCPCPRGSSSPRGTWPAACWPLPRSSRSQPCTAWSCLRCWPQQDTSPGCTAGTNPRKCRRSRPASTCPRGRGLRRRRPCPRGKSSPQGMPPAAHWLKRRCSSSQANKGSLLTTQTQTRGTRPPRKAGSWSPPRSPCRPRRRSRAGSRSCPPRPRPCLEGKRSPRGRAPAWCLTIRPRTRSLQSTGWPPSSRCPFRGSFPRGRRRHRRWWPQRRSMARRLQCTLSPRPPRQCSAL